MASLGSPLRFVVWSGTISSKRPSEHCLMPSRRPALPRLRSISAASKRHGPKFGRPRRPAPGGAVPISALSAEGPLTRRFVVSPGARFWLAQAALDAPSKCEARRRTDQVSGTSHSRPAGPGHRSTLAPPGQGVKAAVSPPVLRPLDLGRSGSPAWSWPAGWAPRAAYVDTVARSSPATASEAAATPNAPGSRTGPALGFAAERSSAPVSWRERLPLKGGSESAAESSSWHDLLQIL